MSGKFEVGYGKPPAEHRFQKGRSGNPKGRPKGAKAKQPQFQPEHQPTDALILSEAYRMVTIREGEKVIELPAVQAAVRSLAISAMKGNRLAQRNLSELVRQVEERRATAHQTALENGFDYKMKWTAELERRKRFGIDEPPPVPHPDDIIIDMRAGEVRIEGPLTAEEKAAQDQRIAALKDAQEEISYCAVQYKKARDPDRKQRWLHDWHWEQRLFDIVNDSLPKRYRLELENRSYQPGASRAGEALKELIEDRARPRSKQKFIPQYDPD